MSENYREVVSKDISLVFSNIEEAYFWIKDLVSECENREVLSACIKDYYEGCVASVTGDSASVGAYLVRELCFGIPSSVFDEIAEDFWSIFSDGGDDAA